jgi:hypothetical protein
MIEMVTGLPILLLAAVQGAAPEPAAPTTGPQTAARPAPEPCATPHPSEDTQEIVVCVERPEGYRIDRDILDAQRQAKRKKLKRPERLADTTCQSVGVMGCMGGGGVNILGAALTAVEMARRAASGENVGEMFVTDPQPDEYQLYLEAKRKREAEKAKAAAAKAKPADVSSAAPE